MQAPPLKRHTRQRFTELELDYRQNKLISKFSIDSDVVFVSYVRLIIILFSLCCTDQYVGISINLSCTYSAIILPNTNIYTTYFPHKHYVSTSFYYWEKNQLYFKLWSKMRGWCCGSQIGPKVKTLPSCDLDWFKTNEVHRTLLDSLVCIMTQLSSLPHLPPHSSSLLFTWHTNTPQGWQLPT